MEEKRSEPLDNRMREYAKDLIRRIREGKYAGLNFSHLRNDPRTIVADIICHHHFHDLMNPEELRTWIHDAENGEPLPSSKRDTPITPVKINN